jgi:hypothetical protein
VLCHDAAAIIAGGRYAAADLGVLIMWLKILGSIAMLLL